MRRAALKMTTLSSPARRDRPAVVSKRITTMRTRMMNPSRMKAPAARTTGKRAKKIKRAEMTMMTRTPKMRMRTWMMESIRMSLRPYRRRQLDLTSEALEGPEAVQELLHSNNSLRRSSQRSEY